MSAASLGVSEARMEARLQKGEERPVNPTTAECDVSLYSHVQRVVDKCHDVHGTWYEIEWRRCWTPASHIPDKTWVVLSLKLNLEPSLRRSTRLAKTVDERKMKNERIARVIHLDL